MVHTHTLGVPRIGTGRALKFALEKYWRQEIGRGELEETAWTVRRENWEHQARLDVLTVGDFSYYDQVLDASFLVGNVPARVSALGGDLFDQYFRAARGKSPRDTDAFCVCAGEMTKWFDTNYHYIVPELTTNTDFSLHSHSLFQQIEEAQALGMPIKPVLIGPVTYLWLGKAQEGVDKLALLPALLAVYTELLEALADKGIDWVQMDEPALVMDLAPHWQEAFQQAYGVLGQSPIQILLASYFGPLAENLELALSMPVAGWHLDAVRGREDVARAVDRLGEHKILSLGVLDGRNIWKTDLISVLDWLEPIHQKLGERLWIAPSCSLLHVPLDLEREEKLDPQIKNWLAFAVQKLQELDLLKHALTKGRGAVLDDLNANQRALEERRTSARIHNPQVQKALKTLPQDLGKRKSPYIVRQKKQAKHIALPPYPTTTIGSFPQTQDIRIARKAHRQGQQSEDSYHEAMKKEISYVIKKQEEIGLDVLVHGEAERNDMVEYFGEHLEGFVFSQFGWVQSYGSRCVKPPILFGDVTRPRPITVQWARYAQSLTQKPVKGMLTGPVTILNWSFVRDDQPRSQTCYQLALAMREEVLDLEKAGISIIQIDEAALREGLPLRKADWKSYLTWAIHAFGIAANGVCDTTQIHTHMCYSQFNEFLADIAKMDADVITIETSRSNMALLEAFKTFNYPNAIGPGVYDIHSPNIPEQSHILELMTKASQHIPPERLWVNPDCGLKTRHWKEVIPALKNMVAAAHTLRKGPR